MTVAHAEEPAGQKPQLWVVPQGTPIRRCEECNARICFVPGKNPGKRIPVSIDSEFAELDVLGAVHGPSHFTDCPNPKRFSRKR